MPREFHRDKARMNAGDYVRPLSEGDLAYIRGGK
jgi:hypothetical protein